MAASQIQHGAPGRLVMSAPTPLREDFDAPQVRGLARKTKDGLQARRLLALAAIYDGATRTEAASALVETDMSVRKRAPVKA